MHRLEYSMWEAAPNLWFCNDVKDLAGIAGKWWVPARMLKISLTDYILLLKDVFHANILNYYGDTDELVYSFKKRTDVKKFVSWINNQAKKINYVV